MIVSGAGADKGSVAVPWRPAIYVAGPPLLLNCCGVVHAPLKAPGKKTKAPGDVSSVKNALMLLDGYFLKEMRDEMPVAIYPHTGIEIKDVIDELDYKHTEIKDCQSELPLGIFEAPPPKWGIIVMNVQIQDDSRMSIVFSGATYNLRHKFLENGLPGNYVNPAGDTPEAKGPYVGILYSNLTRDR